jgi:hypothetical protein
MTFRRPYGNQHRHYMAREITLSVLHRVTYSVTCRMQNEKEKRRHHGESEVLHVMYPYFTVAFPISMT